MYGFVLSMLMRLELGSSGLGVVRKVSSSWVYNGWSTVHGLVMIFVYVMPLGIGGYGNYVLPCNVGVNEMILPRLNSASLWFLVSGVVTISLGGLSGVGLNAG